MSAVAELQPSEPKARRPRSALEKAVERTIAILLLAAIAVSFCMVWANYGLFPWQYPLYYEAPSAGQIIEMFSSGAAIDPAITGRLLGAMIWGVSLPILTMVAYIAIWDWVRAKNKNASNDHATILYVMALLASSAPLLLTTMALGSEHATISAIQTTTSQIRDALKAAGVDYSTVKYPLLSPGK